MSEPPDVQSTEGAPDSRRSVDLLLVFIGGTGGTVARFAVAELLPTPTGLPLGILLINLTGAFLLGLLVEALVHRGPDEGRRRSVRLLVGTGFLGGFTTYSALAVDSVLLLGTGRVLEGIGYLVGTVVVGLAASAAGIAVGGRARRQPGSTAGSSTGTAS
ncbi:CrcB family protein [Arthrobacter echini]|uniref:Fluoride-specific ion channel FluC n=1 Tax=Arthrobacter echini TaxID=1529066 RepID=A0A4S5E553_9MICC|nr:CrcB family protein [Arthrobacter echini]THJ66552.1 CrcB family protein [Arthrobacter echini]